MPTALQLKTAILQYAAELGFEACAVSSPEAAIPATPHLLSWLAAGYAAELGYLQRKPQARCDARSLLPACRSVIVVALELRQLGPHTSWREGGRIARYAQGDDYHRVLAEKLTRLAARLGELVPEHQHKITVDTSPIMEKAYAVAAGIGWQGKHSLVLNAQLGSNFMLGLLLTSVALPPDTPLANLCGTCQRCIEACPTAALVAPAVLDARRCISYRTTAKQAPAPAGSELHGWAYGCDACQDACPFNAAPLADWPL